MISHLVSARSSYSKLAPVIAEVQRQGGDQEVVACGAALLHRYGDVARQIAWDFPHVPVRRLYSAYDGTTLETSAKETASLLSSLTDYYAWTRPSVVVVCGDRHETAAASMAAAYLNLPVAHLQGGERSGNIDDRVRDLNTVLALLHFPCTERAAIRIGPLLRPGSRVYRTGCPSIDVAEAALLDPPIGTTEELGGVGPPLELRHPFLLLVLHPETERPEASAAQMREVLEATRLTPLPRLVLWPGQDAGAEPAAKVIREYVNGHPGDTFHVVRGMAPRTFLRIVAQATVLVGNSSTGIREAGYLGTPVVNVGRRQDGRERGPNVEDVPFDTGLLRQVIQRQISHGRYPSLKLYGRGDAARQIAQVLTGSLDPW